MFKVGDTGKTRGGQDYRVVCVDAEGDNPVVALIRGDNEKDFPVTYKGKGNFFIDGEHPLDLIKQPVREVGYAAMYRDCSGIIEHDIPELAIARAEGNDGYSDRFLEATFEDGKPVEARIVFVEGGE